MSRMGKLSIRNFDWYLAGATFSLIAIGIMAVYSVDLSKGAGLIFFKKQLLAVGLGAILMFGAGFNQFNLWRHSAKWIYLLSVLLLLLVLFFGEVVNNARSWFTVAGFSFQPVELAKLGLILILAYSISRFGRRFERPLFFYGTGLLSFLPVALVLVQPDLGSAVLLGFIWFGIMLLVGARRLHILITVLAIAVVAVAGWSFLLKDYQKQRLATFIDPSQDPLGSGYNITQSIIAIGAGQFTGRGLGFGSQSQLHFLPEARTDFIFAVIGEELGFAGVIAVIILFAVIFWRLIIMMRQTRDDFISVTAAGALILFLVQFFVNIGANIGLLPITGVTLPFVSYGGSSLLINMLLIGILESMVSQRN